MASRDVLLPVRPSSARIFAGAVRTGLGDLRTNYTWWSWSSGWLLRCLMEVAFFGLIGLLLQSREATYFLLIGRGLFVGVAETMWVIQSTAWERGTGTLPLLVSAPGRAWPAFAGRSTQWLPSAVTTSLVSLLVVPPLFGFGVTPEGIAASALAAVVSVVASYGFALPLAAVVLRRPAWRNAASNVTHNVMGLVCGALVPVVFWPAPVQWFAQIFPVTHSLRGLRAVLDGEPDAWGALAAGLGLALALGAAWFAIGAWLLERFAEAARHGTIDIDS
ncbi:ABC transporter permease [Microbacterium jejuense]|uniref:ABC transporter permease n=1 Tax=Microbacterium jejuense TaxID=1263637 RepID=UPI0031EC158A